MNECASEAATSSCGGDAGKMTRKLNFMAICPSVEYLKCDDLDCAAKAIDKENIRNNLMA